eukprot:4639738-Amphidinium_carterae.1
MGSDGCAAPPPLEGGPKSLASLDADEGSSGCAFASQQTAERSPSFLPAKMPRVHHIDMRSWGETFWKRDFPKRVNFHA